MLANYANFQLFSRGDMSARGTEAFRFDVDMSWL